MRCPLSILLLTLSLLVFPACNEDLGETCERNSDCSDPRALCVEGLCQLECIDERDCERGQLCINAFCVDPAQNCAVDRDCRFGQRCVSGICEDQATCTLDSECASNERCDATSATCVTVITPSGCQGDASCDPGLICEGTECVPGCDTTGCDTGQTCEQGRCRTGCASEADCSGNDRCMGGSCTPGCASRSDCSGGQICNLQGLCGDCSATSECSLGERCSSGRCEPEPQPENPYAGTFLLSTSTGIQPCNIYHSLQYEARTTQATQNGLAYTFTFPESVYPGTIDSSGRFSVSWSGYQFTSAACGEMNSSNTYTGTFESPDLFRGTLTIDIFFQVSSCNCKLFFDITGTRQ